MLVILGTLLMCVQFGTFKTDQNKLCNLLFLLLLVFYAVGCSDYVAYFDYDCYVAYVGFGGNVAYVGFGGYVGNVGYFPDAWAVGIGNIALLLWCS
jgi:hypothetical protein